jgi:hypothetical protein
MTRTRTSVLGVTFFLVAGTLAFFLVFFSGKSSSGGFVPKLGQTGTETDMAGESPRMNFEAYRSATRTYPANVIPPSVVARAKATFNRIAIRDARLARSGRSFLGHEGKWRLYGPKKYAFQPGVTSFNGAANVTAARTVALVADPDCKANRCKVWAGVSGGGVWVTENIIAPDPEWKQLSPEDLDQNSVGQLVLDPTDRKHDTLYLGTGEGNRCSSGCEAGVGVYKSTNGGKSWHKLAARCVSNATYTCANPGKDSFLGRGINGIVIDPRNGQHIYVGSAQAVRGLSHTIGNGGTTRLAPGANEPGLYESTDGGTTFTEVWDGAKPTGGVSFGITDVGLDPLNLDRVYVSGFDAGVWRRDTGPGTTTFQQVFKPNYVPPQCAPIPGGSCGFLGIDRTMFALTVKAGHTRIYLGDGTQNANGPAHPDAATFWRTDMADQPAASLLATQAAGATPPNPATHTFPAFYPGWQKLSSPDTSNPYYATIDFCWAQCWYDEDIYTPAGLPDTVYAIGAFQYGELACNTKGVGCGNGVSNGRGILYSNTAGDPDSVNNMRTFTDLTNDSRDTFAPWCAYAQYGLTFCLRAPNGLHPDQHEIIVNPGNPTQVIESNDGGVFRLSGTFTNISSQCDEPGRDGNTGGPPTGGNNLACKRLLSRVPTALDHIDKKLGSTIQFINVAINPADSCEVMGGTQDNGTWSNNDHCDRNTFNQVIYGDGGNAAYDATNPTWRANEFTSGFGDANFRNGDPEKWVITTAPVTRSGEGPAFYWPQISDPNPVAGTHPIYSGAKHVWRSLAWGAGTPTTAGPQGTTPNIAQYEANCPEFVTPGTLLGCGDYRPMGGPYCDGVASTATVPSCINQPGDLTGTVYGSDRGGGSMSFMARSGADHGTLWAATSAGRLFVTHNADVADPELVTWHRIDNATSPTRFPSAIYVDPANSSHAWVTYSGYNISTPTTPGHVFEVTENAAPGTGTFVNLNVESGGTSNYPTPADNGDLPVADVVRDDATHTLYVATDFGVLRGSNDGHGGWHVTKGMPRYEVMHLEIQPSNRVPTCVGGGHCERLIYAATHSQGIWKMKLGGKGHGHGHDDDHGHGH